ncbi:MAG: hypothetical protein WC054_02335 [Candidatus Nanopelagicales bacterium]
MARKWIAQLTANRVAVHTVNGESLRGILLAVHGDCLVLTAAQILSEHGARPLDGDVVVPREQVAWIQQLPPAEAVTG